MVVSAFVKMCKIMQLLPHSSNIESLYQLIKQIITPMTNDEHRYFEEDKMLITVYEQDQNPEKSKINPLDREPGLLFHEFIFLLALMALNGDTCTEYANKTEQIEVFFKTKLNL